MVNFVYLIGDRVSGECLVVDPAYGVAEIAAIAAADDMALSGALVTHYHPDHCGGSMMGMQIEGVTELLAMQQMPVHVQADEAEWVHEGHRSGTGGSEHPRLGRHGHGGRHRGASCSTPPDTRPGASASS